MHYTGPDMGERDEYFRQYNKAGGAIPVRVPQVLADELRTLAEKEGTTRSKYVRDLLAEHVSASTGKDAEALASLRPSTE